ncbi:MAG: autotransporter outer membrane beta-barrel domain-containing protein [Rhodoferax sp.]|nr:autotransporter outer membrane beta-barrel domain-containing protein [Rhodoferax sp.]
MLDDLMVSEAGGVKQFYGGKLVERLAEAYGAGADTAQVFAKSSPEVYAGLVDQGRESLLNSTLSVLDQSEPSGSGLSAKVLHRNLETDNGSGYANYAVKASGVQVGYDSHYSSGRWSASLGLEDGSLSGSYLNGKSNGYAASLSAAHNLTAAEGLQLTGRVTLASHGTNLTRQTNDGVARADDVSSNSWLLGGGLAYRTTIGGYRLHTAVEAASYGVSVDSFLEKNSQSVLDALQVQQQKETGTALILSAALGKKLTDNVDFSAGVRLIRLSGNAQEVTANIASESTDFTVQNPGLGGNQASADVGVTYKMTDSALMSMSLRANGSQGLSADLVYRKAF